MLHCPPEKNQKHGLASPKGVWGGKHGLPPARCTKLAPLPPWWSIFTETGVSHQLVRFDFRAFVSAFAGWRFQGLTVGILNQGSGGKELRLSTARVYETCLPASLDMRTRHSLCARLEYERGRSRVYLNRPLDMEDGRLSSQTSRGRWGRRTIWL